MKTHKVEKVFTTSVLEYGVLRSSGKVKKTDLENPMKFGFKENFVGIRDMIAEFSKNDFPLGTKVKVTMEVVK